MDLIVEIPTGKKGEMKQYTYERWGVQIPRLGEVVVIDHKGYKVVNIVWDMETGKVNLTAGIP